MHFLGAASGMVVAAAAAELVNAKQCKLPLPPAAKWNCNHDDDDDDDDDDCVNCCDYPGRDHQFPNV